jgi:Fibronectin type III domain
VPGPPTITQVNAGNGVMTVAWAPPASDGGRPVLRYQVTAAPSGATRSVGASVATVTLDGLTDGVRYCVQVQAVNQVGGGPLSPAGVSCATPLQDSPGQVGGVRASESVARQITLSWRAPSLGPYNTPVISYTVRGGPATQTATSTSTVIAGLANGTTYSFSVTATNKSGNSGPGSAPAKVTTWSAPAAVGRVSVTAGDKQLTIKWPAASVAAGSPKVSGYDVSVGGSSLTTTSTSVTRSVPAWTNENVTVYAVNSVGKGAGTAGSGTAYARTATAECLDVLSGDLAILNACPAPGGAWESKGNSTIDWVSSQPSRTKHPGNRYLCVTYYTGTESGDRYALSTSSSGCPALLSGYQPPDTPHPIAYVSTTSIGSGSQHVCEYKGTTKGNNGTFTSYELSPCGRIPSGLSGASEQFSFYT